MWIPPKVSAPARAAARISGVTRGLYTRSYTRTPGGICCGCNGVSPSFKVCAIPIVVQLTIKSALTAAKDSSSQAIPIDLQSIPICSPVAASRSALCKVRFAITHSITLSWINACNTPLAAPPAPRTRTLLSRHSNRRSIFKPCKNPYVSVL